MFGCIFAIMCLTFLDVYALSASIFAYYLYLTGVLLGGWLVFVAVAHVYTVALASHGPLWFLFFSLNEDVVFGGSVR